MGSLRLLIHSLSVICAGLVFAGCPHHVEKLIDDALPPENYEPDYLNSSVPWDQLKDKYAGAAPIPTLAQIQAIDSLQNLSIPPESWPSELRDVHSALSSRNQHEHNSAGGDQFLSDLAQVLTARDSLRRAGVHPSEWPPEIAKLPSPVIKMDVRSVDDNRYPDEVELHAYVFDTAGTFISGLAPPKFTGQGRWQDYWHRLIDSCGGEAAVIENYSVEEVSEENREPYSLAFVLDHSASMGRRRVAILRKAVGLLLKGISKDDNVSVVSFTQGSFIEIPLTGSKREWVTGFDPSDLSTYGGGTKLYDAVVRGIEEVDRGPEGAKRVLVIFSDGGDGNSKAKLAEVHRLAKKRNVALYTIAYGLADQDVLNNLAQYTGGRMYRIYRSEEFLHVFIDIYRRLNHYYRITYNPPECAGIHTVRPSLRLPELNLYGLEGTGIYDRSVITPFDSVGRIVFVNIEFDYNKATIRPESAPLVQDVADAMQRYPEMTMEIRGHTDDQGAEDYNLELSEERAEAVADFLVEKGVDRSRLSVRGYGETNPLVANDSEENRRRNRRTEFVILSR